ncbi:hypothetical protein RRG08_054272, partial [Elysia crispata]
LEEALNDWRKEG